VNLDVETSMPTTRYWKWVGLHDEIRGVFRLKGHIFQIFKNGSWQQSDYLERASKDPDFPEINEDEAIELIEVFTRQQKESSSEREP
jgi:hypothetical protein